MSRTGRQLGQATLTADLRGPEDLGSRGRLGRGQLNFVFDPEQTPHTTADQLSEWLGVKESTMSNKARLIRDSLKPSHFDTQFMRKDLVEASPLTWILQVDGIPVDIRRAPAHLQVHAFELGPTPTSPGPPMTRP